MSKLRSPVGSPPSQSYQTIKRNYDTLISPKDDIVIIDDGVRKKVKEEQAEKFTENIDMEEVYAWIVYNDDKMLECLERMKADKNQLDFVFFQRAIDKAIKRLEGKLDIAKYVQTELISRKDEFLAANESNLQQEIVNSKKKFENYFHNK